MARRAIGIMAFALFLGGCVMSSAPEVEHVDIPTRGAPAGGVNACMDALASGTIVDDPRWGVALVQDDGSRMQVVWPAGYAARRVDGALELLDETGHVVARAGDVVMIAGGMGAGEAWFACGPPEPAVDMP